MGMNINFVIFKPYRVFGYRKVKKGNSYVLLADIEKMVVDSLYLPRYTVFENIISTLHEGFDKELLEKYNLEIMKKYSINEDQKNEIVVEAMAENW